MPSHVIYNIIFDLLLLATAKGKSIKHSMINYSHDNH